ncbi:hypothetical protein RBB75_07600 [Tunturibacter empetritectus]|uniref:DUF1579 domain-containing protein n=1 Tax=Tunturiibacter empetritectus TaxID=3069691 RepID=A0AAU7ZH98_9BACT
MIPQLQKKIQTLILVASLVPSIYANAQAPQKDLNANFVGKWVGQLEYRDFQSNAQVFLPTWLIITETTDQKALQFNYVYDDGPSKTVRELMIVTLDPVVSKITFTSDRDKSSDTYTLQGLDDFSKTGRGTLILSGPGKENDKPVDVRITLTLRRNLYTYRKETRRQGEDFKFRDAYTFTRAEPPTSQ